MVRESLLTDSSVNLNFRSLACGANPQEEPKEQDKEGPMEMVSAEGKMIPALPDLFTWDEGQVRLISAHCRSCGTYFFPEFHQQHRPGCSRQGIEKVLLNKNGVLKSYTIQYYMPPLPFKASGNITPYVIGLVEFPEGIQIAGIVRECPFEELKIGLDMQVTTYVLYKNDQDQEVVTWAFRPTNPIR